MSALSCHSVVLNGWSLWTHFFSLIVKSGPKFTPQKYQNVAYSLNCQNHFPAWFCPQGRLRRQLQRPQLQTWPSVPGRKSRPGGRRDLHQLHQQQAPGESAGNSAVSGTPPHWTQSGQSGHSGQSGLRSAFSGSAHLVMVNALCAHSHILPCASAAGETKLAKSSPASPR